MRVWRRDSDDAARVSSGEPASRGRRLYFRTFSQRHERLFHPRSGINSAGRLRRLEMMQDPMRTSRPRASRRRAPARTTTHFESVEPRLLFATFTVTNTNNEGP